VFLATSPLAGASRDTSQGNRGLFQFTATPADLDSPASLGSPARSVGHFAGARPGKWWAVAAEGEHGQGDEGFGPGEAKRDPGQDADLGVG